MGRLGHAMINLPTKFEVPSFTHYGDMKDVGKWTKWVALGWLGVTLSGGGLVQRLALLVASTKLTNIEPSYDTIRYDTTILMCAQKLTDDSLIYRTVPKTKTSKMKN